MHCKRVLSSHAWSCPYKLKAAINALLVRLRKSLTRYPRHSRHGKLQVLTHQPFLVRDVVDAQRRVHRAWHLQRCNKLIARRGSCILRTATNLHIRPAAKSAPRLQIGDTQRTNRAAGDGACNGYRSAPHKLKYPFAPVSLWAERKGDKVLDNS